MRFTFVVDIEVERQRGKFATRDEISNFLQEALEGADPGDYQGENDGEYGITSWDVNEKEGK